MQEVEKKRKMRRSRKADKFIKALEEMQKAMEGEAERTGLDTEEKVVAFCKEVRRELIY